MVPGGGYIVFLESDDIITPDYLELKIKAANEFPQAGIIFNDAKLIGDVNSKRACAIQKTLDRKKELINKENVDFYNLYIENLIISFSFVMVKKELLFNIPLDFNIPQCYDWYLWNNILNKNNIVIFIDKPLTNFRIHETSQSCTKVSSSYLLEKLKQDKNEFKSVSQKIYYNIFRIILVNNRMEKLFRPLYKRIKKIFCCKLYNLKNKIIKVIKL